MIKNLFLAALKMALGVLCGLLLLEAAFRSNTGLLLRGMAVPAPVDPPITVKDYAVRYSDADLFFWHPQLIRPVPAESDRVEARVHFETDEFGFPNSAPLPETVDVVVLGRSYSLGAQAANPWTRLLAAQAALKVLNLSQTGSGIDVKLQYLKDFGLPRRPRWIVVEVLPSLDIVGYAAAPPLLLQRLPVPLIQSLARRAQAESATRPSAHPIYPLPMDIPGRTVDLTFFSYYLSALTVDRSMLMASRQWVAYQRELLEIVRQAQDHSACVLLLYAPAKSNIYLPLATHPEQLTPILTAGWSPWRLSPTMELITDPTAKAEIAQLRANASVAREALAEFAKAQGLPFADPTDELTQAALSGDNPFMAYDTHWSTAGQQIVARLVAEMLQSAACP